MTARRTGIASVAALAALTLTVGVVHAVAPDWARQLGLDVWNISDAETDARRADETGHHLHARAERVTRQIQAGDHIGRTLAAGRTTLAAAVEELLRINDARADFLVGLRCMHWDAGSDRERVARYALGKVQLELAGDPVRLAGVMRALGGEYAAMFGTTWTPAE